MINASNPIYQRLRVYDHYKAEYIAHDWHDWVSDRHALGIWLATPLGGETGLEAANWDRFERIAFATSADSNFRPISRLTA